MAKDPSPLKATIRLVEPTQHAYTIGLAHRTASMLHFLKG
jgi:phosphotransferase system IIA component